MPTCPTCDDERRVVLLESDRDAITLLMPQSKAWRLLQDLAPHALDPHSWNLHCVQRLGARTFLDRATVPFYERSRLLVSGKASTVRCPDCSPVRQQGTNS